MRNYKDWLQAYLKYTNAYESPEKLHFWTGVSTIASVLRRKVWLPFTQDGGNVYPNLYIFIVARSGIVSKTTTINIGKDMLRQIPGIALGPDILTWQSVPVVFKEAEINIHPDPQDPELFEPMCAITFSSGELGNLLNPSDRDMLDLFVKLWDGERSGLSKVTKTMGSDAVQNPWCNLIACTTPDWFEGYVPEYIIGGGFTSRVIFLYAEKKRKFTPWPLEQQKIENTPEMQKKLLEDLYDMNENLNGEYSITQDALDWGAKWYVDLYEREIEPELADTRFTGHHARRQVHMLKVAIIIAASQGNKRELTKQHLQTANTLIESTTPDMQRVFNLIGRDPRAKIREAIIATIKQSKCIDAIQLFRMYDGRMAYADFKACLESLNASGRIYSREENKRLMLYYADRLDLSYVEK